MFHFYICDDNHENTEQLLDLLKRLSESMNIKISIELVCHNSQQFINLFNSKSSLYNIYILDIELESSLSGLDLSKVIRKHDPLGHIIFLTNYMKYLPYTFDYLVSPISYILRESEGVIQNKLQASLEEIQSRLDEKFSATKTEELFTVKIHNRIHYFYLNDIILFEYIGNHRISLLTNKESITFYSSMRRIITDYPKLVRVHESFIINPEHILSIDFHNKRIYLNQNLSCPIGSSYLSRLKNKLPKQIR